MKEYKCLPLNWFWRFSRVERELNILASQGWTLTKAPFLGMFMDNFLILERETPKRNR